ncbi:hypothetical protein GCM10027402_12570 [Arthrobacter monumenti]
MAPPNGCQNANRWWEMAPSKHLWEMTDGIADEVASPESGAGNNLLAGPPYGVGQRDARTVRQVGG